MHLRAILFSLFAVLLFQSCKEKEVVNTEATTMSKPKFSLAQWSFHNELFAKKMTTQDFIREASRLGFEGVEYVNQFFMDKVENKAYLDSLNATAKEVGIKNLLIMVDRAGNLGASRLTARDSAVAMHKKWVDAAKYLGCTAIRINAHGDGTAEQVLTACTDGIGKLADYAATQDMNIIIENHGGHSSKADWMVSLIKKLDGKRVYTLPDFDNWCYERAGGNMYQGECTGRYDRIKGMEELMPYAKAVSVKSFAFDSIGNETTMDYPKLISIIKQSGYQGYLGVEFEGDSIAPQLGIAATKKLVERVW
jgi:sugar phosphate isomerase/epimerase